MKLRSKIVSQKIYLRKPHKEVKSKIVVQLLYDIAQ